MYIIAVPTHFNRESKKIDPYHLIAAVNSIVATCKPNSIVVVESTVSPGTIEEFLVPLGRDKHIIFAHAPERIIPGSTLYEITHNDRVIGSDDVVVCEQVKEAYQSFCEGSICTTNLRTAELTKVVENTFRDINIAYANELKKICQKMSVDVYEVIRLANRHPRVNILNPSAGVGGHCISVDPWFLVGDFPKEAKLIAEARRVNDSMPSYTWHQFLARIKTNKIGIYGLTYKPNIDDIRESPALQLLEYLKAEESTRDILLYDPFLKTKISNNQILDFNQFIESTEAILIMAPHDHLKSHLASIEKKKITVFDPFNFYGSGINKL
jgi:UDP-N-acetyl-D-mannosaminuronic acid dehydrogenase